MDNCYYIYIMKIVIKAFKMHPRSNTYTWKFRILGRKATICKWGNFIPSLTKSDIDSLIASN